MIKPLVALVAILLLPLVATGEVQPAGGVRLVPIAPGYARNTVNVAIFRKSSLITHGDTQFAAFTTATATLCSPSASTAAARGR